MNARVLPNIVGPAMATGNNRAVMATRNSEMPSTPTFPADPEVADPLVLADELEAGLAALEVDHQIGDESQFDDRRQQPERHDGFAPGTRRGQERDHHAARRGRNTMMVSRGKPVVTGDQLPTRVAMYASRMAAPMPMPSA